MADEESPAKPLVLLRVLVADSGSSVNDALTALLSEIDGISVFGCAQEEDKILVLAQGLQPDLVILDLQRTKPVSLAIFKWLKALPGAPLVIALCEDDSICPGEAMSVYGADHTLLRTDCENLLGIINGMIAKGRGNA
jgi:DNA-binding NarL/FixJ family response regulator